MTSHQSSLDAGPWWTKVLSKEGAATLIALFLVYWVTGRMTLAMDKMAEGMVRNAEVLSLMHVDHAEQRIYLRSICVGVAVPTDRWRCYPSSDDVEREAGK